MPIYEFECPQCGHTIEVLVRNTDADYCPACSACGSAVMRKKISETFVPRRGEFIESIVKKNEKKEKINP